MAWTHVSPESKGRAVHTEMTKRHRETQRRMDSTSKCRVDWCGGAGKSMSGWLPGFYNEIWAVIRAIY